VIDSRPRSYILGALLLVAMVAWAVWLICHRKNLVDYMAEEASARPPLPLCSWVPMTSKDVVKLGFSLDGGSVWTFQKTALLAFRTKGRTPWYVDIGVVAVVGDGITMSADGGAPHTVPKVERLPRGEVVRLPLSLHTKDGVHVVLTRIPDPKRPNGTEQRWLGVAMAHIRACDSLQHPNG